MWAVPMETEKEKAKEPELAWDPDFTKLTPDEAASLDEALKEMESGDYVLDGDIDWN